MNTLIETAPARIWLQIDPQGAPVDCAERFPSDASEVTWCADDVGGVQVEYVRADLASAAQPAAVAVLLNELEELNLLNKLIDLGARAASAHAKSNSDDGHAGTVAYVQWRELRADMGELIRKAYTAPTTQEAPQHAAQGDALDAARWRYAVAIGGNQVMNWLDVYNDWNGEGYFADAIDAARAKEGASNAN